MRIVPFRTRLAWAEHKGYNRPAVKTGTIRYAIRYAEGGYFTYSYLNRVQAERVMAVLKRDGVAREFNLIQDIDNTIPVKVKPEEDKK